jgi:drug/metabolite transporter (DMT)-like permease
MKRWQADGLLGLTGLVWGFGFVAQKDALTDIGPATFVACRFLLSALFIFPLVLRELKKTGVDYLRAGQKTKRRIFALCIVFTISVLSQQYGLLATNVTKAAFITSLYIVMVPFAGLMLYQYKITAISIIASLLSFLGVALLTGGGTANVMNSFTWGDGLVLICAIFYALQVPMLGHIVGAVNAPLVLSFLQFLVLGCVALIFALVFEHIDLQALLRAGVPILYAGILAGGIAYTFQAVAQQHTPPSDSALLMSTETLFGAIGGAWLMHDRLSATGYIGCALIVIAIIVVEVAPLLRRRATP